MQALEMEERDLTFFCGKRGVTRLNPKSEASSYSKPIFVEMHANSRQNVEHTYLFVAAGRQYNDMPHCKKMWNHFGGIGLTPN